MEEALARKAEGGSGNKLLKEEVTESDIAEIISKWTGEPWLLGLGDVDGVGVRPAWLLKEVTESDIAEIISKRMGEPCFCGVGGWGWGCRWWWLGGCSRRRAASAEGGGDRLQRLSARDYQRLDG